MMKEWKVSTDKNFLLKHMGAISQLAGIKRYHLAEGRGRGVEALESHSTQTAVTVIY